MRQWDAPGETLLLSMGILPGWRGRGLGQFFVGCTLRCLASEGLEAVTLHVGAHNRRAVKLYREVGFEEVGELQAPGSAPDPVLQGLNVLLGCFEEESEGEAEADEGEGFDDGSDDSGGWQWDSDGEGEAVGAGA